jgi:hypothetical protein
VCSACRALHYDEAISSEVIELAAVIGLSKYLNRLNDALKMRITPTEPVEKALVKTAFSVSSLGG